MKQDPPASLGHPTRATHYQLRRIHFCVKLFLPLSHPGQGTSEPVHSTTVPTKGVGLWPAKPPNAPRRLRAVLNESGVRSTAASASPCGSMKWKLRKANAFSVP